MPSADKSKTFLKDPALRNHIKVSVNFVAESAERSITRYFPKDESDKKRGRSLGAAFSAKTALVSLDLPDTATVQY